MPVTYRLTLKAEPAAAASLPRQAAVTVGSGDVLDETLVLMAACEAQVVTTDCMPHNGEVIEMSFAALARRLASGHVGPRVRVAVMSGWWRAGYGRERDAVCALAAAGHQLGAPPGFSQRVLAHPLAKLSESNLDPEWVNRLERSVRERITESDARRQQAVARTARWAATVPLSCTRPSTSRAVLEALAAIAASSCRHSFGAGGTESVLVAVSFRRIAAEANLNPATVRRVLTRLTDSGVLVKHPPLKATHATLWELPSPQMDGVPARSFTPWSDLGDDAAHAYALGKTLALTLRAMTPGVSFSAAELAGALSSSPSAVRTRLNRLRRLGLVVREGKRWTAHPVAPSQVAVHFGTTGLRARRRTEYRRAREARAAQMARHSKARRRAS